MPIRKLRDFLDEHDIKYVVISHSPAYTAQEIAASAHVPGKELAKTVMIEIDGEMAMAVLPASYQIDFDRLKEVTGENEVNLASEEAFESMFPDCEVGAMPPFGNLYDMNVLVAKSLTDDEEIAFNAGSHRELVRMKYSDFEELVKPKVAAFSYKAS